ncbi:MAG: methyltransferase domain-containing protein [Deltaproteobacteria bacterium]|nr:methyltransferase domain-containing protein [Deltaproteobacteria bacterium]
MRSFDEAAVCTVSPACIAKQAMPGEEKRAWRSLWSEDKTFWDLGEAHPSLPPLLERARIQLGFELRGARVFVPGCGRGHEAAYLARQGARVEAVDYAPEAIEAARQRYPDVPGLTFEVADAFHAPPAAQGRFDAVVDRAMLCAIESSDRPRYLRACAERLRPGGLLVSVAFLEVRLPSGPPFPISADELSSHTCSWLDPVIMEPVLATTMTDYIHRELLVIQRKRSSS